MVNTNFRKVKRRRVFYIPGYDPFPARRYRELYRKEGDEQADISGYEIAIKGKPGKGSYGWHVKSRIDDNVVGTDIDVLMWSDIVSRSMQATIAGTYWQLAQTAWVYITTGTLRRLMWLRKGPVIAALYPVGMLVLQLMVAVGVAWLLGSLVSRLVYPAVGWIAGLPVMLLILRWFKNQDRRFFVYYLMHDYAFTARHKGAYPPILEERMSEFAEKIAAALKSDVEEVLVVGHSSGAHLAISILADLLRENRVPDDGPALGFLSLGQVVPMASFLPKAQRLRADLHNLSQSNALTWVDVTAPGDGCSFALCDPVAVSGVSPTNRLWPLVISAAFTKTLSEKRWNNLKRRFFRLHFQYLCAFDRPGDYDYFKITAGPLTLAERFYGRKPSANRIDVVASKHTSTTA
jgi:hypothetical protein